MGGDRVGRVHIGGGDGGVMGEAGGWWCMGWVMMYLGKGGGKCVQGGIGVPGVREGAAVVSLSEVKR